MPSLTDYIPAIDLMDEKAILKLWKKETGTSIWAEYDLIIFLMNLSEKLDEYEMTDNDAYNLADHLIDFMMNEDMGQEYTGMTPWMGEGFQFWEF